MKMNMAENQKVQIDEMMREKKEKTVLMVMWRTTGNCDEQPQCLYALEPKCDHNRGVSVPMQR